MILHQPRSLSPCPSCCPCRFCCDKSVLFDHLILHTRLLLIIRIDFGDILGFRAISVLSDVGQLFSVDFCLLRVSSHIKTATQRSLGKFPWCGNRRFEVRRRSRRMLVNLLLGYWKNSQDPSGEVRVNKSETHSGRNPYFVHIAVGHV